MILNTGAIQSKTPEPFSMANVLIEMRTMGIDPTPFLEITAQDLHFQYGSRAIELSVNIEKNLILERDFQSAKLWHKISHYLKNMPASGSIEAH